MPSSHLILCLPLLLLPPIPPSIRVFSNDSTLRMRCQSTGVSALASFLPKKSHCFSLSDLLHINTFFRAQEKTHHLFHIFSLCKPGEGNGNPLQYSFLENSMDRGVWWATIHGVTESDTTKQLTHTLCKLSITISTNSRGCLNTELAVAQCSSYNNSQNNNLSCSIMNHLVGRSCWLTGYLKSSACTKWNVGFLFFNRSWIGLLMFETLAQLRTLSLALFHVFLCFYTGNPANTN